MDYFGITVFGWLENHTNTSTQKSRHERFAKTTHKISQSQHQPSSTKFNKLETFKNQIHDGRSENGKRFMIHKKVW